MATVDASSLDAVLAQLRARGTNLQVLLPQIGEALIAAVSDVYDAEGPGWDPLAESTLRQRRGGGGGAKMLRDTGLMQRTQVALGSDYAEAYSPAPYAQYHVTGTSKMPKRNPFDLGPFENELLADVGDMLAAELTK